MTARSWNRSSYYAVSLGVSALVGSAVYLIHPAYSLDAAALGLFVTYLLISMWNVHILTPDYLSRNARQADLPVLFMFVVVLLVIATCVGSLFQLINSAEDPDPLRLVLALSAVAFAWLTVHTMYGFHYAHICWLDEGIADARHAEKVLEKARGLDFPGDEEPGGLDFIYFSFVIGMTAQTADVDTTTTHVRRVVLVHSILAYLFNTVIVAAAVNLAVSLGH